MWIQRLLPKSQTPDPRGVEVIKRNVGNGGGGALRDIFQGKRVVETV